MGGAKEHEAPLVGGRACRSSRGLCFEMNSVSIARLTGLMDRRPSSDAFLAFLHEAIFGGATQRFSVPIDCSAVASSVLAFVYKAILGGTMQWFSVPSHSPTFTSLSNSGASGERCNQNSKNDTIHRVSLPFNRAFARYVSMQLVHAQAAIGHRLHTCPQRFEG